MKLEVKTVLVFVALFILMTFTLQLVLGEDLAKPNQTELSSGETTLVSRHSSGTIGNDYSASPGISSDGRYVVFYSKADNLTDNHVNNYLDVYVHDRNTGLTSFVAGALLEKSDFSPIGRPTISDDGRLIGFPSKIESLIEDDKNEKEDVFVRDMQSGEIRIISLQSDGSPTNGDSGYPSMSADGRYVAFQTTAYNLEADDKNGCWDVFVHDMYTHKTTLVSKNTAGKIGDGCSLEPSISSDGRYVAFRSSARNLTTGDKESTGYEDDIFVHDLETGETKHISRHLGDVYDRGNAYRPSISGDGRYVAFESFGSNLVVGDTNEAGDIFVHDRETDEITLISKRSDGVQAEFNSYWPSISGDGRFVTFSSDAYNLIDDYYHAPQIFVHDRVSKETDLVSRRSDGSIAINTSRDSVISANGQIFAFTSWDRLVDEDNNNNLDVYVRDLQAAPVTYQVSGKVKDRDGNPLSSATVSIESGPTTSTDENGEYEFNNLSSGEYVVTASIPYYEHIFPESWTLVVPPDQMNIDFEARNLLDSDGDALPDLWEIEGVTVDTNGSNGNGSQFVNLPAMGADPYKKDIFVEIDWMEDGGVFAHSHKPKPEAIEKIVKSFADSPNGGINLHVDVGPDSIDYVTGEKWGALSNGNSLPNREYLTSDDWVDYVEQHFNHSSRVFHYSLFAHKLDPHFRSPDENLVCASGMGTLQYFIVALGGWPNCANTKGGYGTSNQQAGVFMHELGHSLGLEHEGDQISDDEKEFANKPNYLSVMNYQFTVSGLTIDGRDGHFDYSRHDLPDINEAALAETVGLNGGEEIDRYGTKHYCAPSTPKGTLGIIKFWTADYSNETIDWNCNFSDDSGLVQADINGNETNNQILTGFNDWENLVFTGQSIGPFPEGQLYSIDTSFQFDPRNLPDELTEEESLHIQQLGDPRVLVQLFKSSYHVYI